MNYEIRYSNQASKFLKNADSVIAKRILDKIDELKENPYPSESSKVKGTNYYRARVGKFRIVYDIDNKNNVLGVVKIDKRERVYD